MKTSLFPIARYLIRHREFYSHAGADRSCKEQLPETIDTAVTLSAAVRKLRKIYRDQKQYKWLWWVSWMAADEKSVTFFYTPTYRGRFYIEKAGQRGVLS